MNSLPLTANGPLANKRLKASLDDLLSTSKNARAIYDGFSKIFNENMESTASADGTDELTPDQQDQIDELFEAFPEVDDDVIPELGNGTTIQRLSNLVLILTSKISALSDVISEMSRVDVSDDMAENPEKIAEFKEKFKTSVQDQTLATLKLGYDKKVLKDWSPRLRVIVCDVLVNLAQNANIAPSDVWLDVLTNNGNI